MKKGIYVLGSVDYFTNLRNHFATNYFELFREKEVPEHAEIQFIIIDNVAMSSFPLVAAYRKQYPYTAILVLTSIRNEHDMLQSFANGVDDYQVKPCSVREVVARIRVILKRREGILEWLEGSMQHQLTRMEHNILQLLIKHKNSLLTREQMIQALWHNEMCVDSKVIDVHIYNLRKKLGNVTNGTISIKTVTNKGFTIVMNSNSKEKSRWYTEREG